MINMNLNDAASHEMSQSEINLHVLHTVLDQQSSLKARLTKFGGTGKKAGSIELQQLHDMETYVPVDPMSLTKEERHQALSSSIFLTEKKRWCCQS